MSLDIKTRTAILDRAGELAQAAPPLTGDQSLLLVSVFARYRESSMPQRSDDSAKPRWVSRSVDRRRNETEA